MKKVKTIIQDNPIEKRFKDIEFAIGLLAFFAGVSTVLIACLSYQFFMEI